MNVFVKGDSCSLATMGCAVGMPVARLDNIPTAIYKHYVLYSTKMGFCIVYKLDIVTTTETYMALHKTIFKKVLYRTL